MVAARQIVQPTQLRQPSSLRRPASGGYVKPAHLAEAHGADQSLVAVRQAFEFSLAGKSPHTAKSYATGLDRFFDFLADASLNSELIAPADLPADAPERFYVWLVGRYGRTNRSTHT